MSAGVRLEITPLPDGALEISRELAADTAAIDQLERELALARQRRRENAARAYWSGTLSRGTIAELTNLSERQISKHVRELEPAPEQRDPRVVAMRQRRTPAAAAAQIAS